MKDDMNEKEPLEDIELTGEDNIDDPEPAEMEATTRAKVTQLRTKLKVCESEKKQLQDDLQRTKADFLNARKRLEEEKLRYAERQTTKHIEHLLPLCDSFAMAMSNKEVWEKVDPDWRKGVESIYQQLQKIMDSYAVELVHPLGEEFDPSKHEAMSEVAVTDETEDQKILAVIQPGYLRKIGEEYELIRPARVTVGVLKA
jgi:molecular chaperone GrpE